MHTETAHAIFWIAVSIFFFWLISISPKERALLAEQDRRRRAIRK